MKINRVKNYTLKILAVVTLASLLFACAGAAKSKDTATGQKTDFGGLGQSSDPVPLMSKVISGTLPSGLRYFILENTKPEGRAYLTLAVNAGSVLETEEERGLAHFAEHMAFNGTARFPKMGLINYLRSLGMRFGADANAYTSFDETVYGIEVPVEEQDGRKRIPDRALAIIDDWTHAVTFDPQDMDGERKVIMEEYRTRLGAMERVRRILLPVIFRGSPYAQREPIGLLDVIENAPVETLVDFYRKWYQADNMAVIFVGDFDGKALEAELADHFTIPAPKQPTKRPEYQLPPPQKGNFHVEVITDPELTFTSFNIYYKRKSETAKATLGAYRQDVIDNLIETMLALRFDEAASRPETSYVESMGGAWNFGRSARFYLLGTQAKTGLAEDSLREMLLEKESIVRYGFTNSELEHAKLSLISMLEQMASEKDRQESRSYVYRFTAHFLNKDNLPDIEWELDAVSRLLPGIGLAEITVAVRDYFADDDCTVFVIAPAAEAASLPSKERVREIFAEAAKATISPRESAVLSGELLEAEPQPGSLSAETRDAETGALIWQLSNGAKLILKETQNRNNEIIFYAMARGGTTSAPESGDISVRLASAMLTASGLGSYSRTELVKKLAGKQVSLSFWDSNYYRGFQGSATTRDIKTLFEMLYLEFTQPRIDADTVKALLDQQRTNLAWQEEDPETVFYNEVTRTMYNNHPRFKPMELADLDRVSVEQAMRYIKTCMNPADYTFVFTGNLNLEEMKNLTQTYLASIPRAPAWDTWTDIQEGRPGKIEKRIYKGKEEQSMVFLGWFGPVEYSEEKSQAAAILTEYLDIIMTEEIRETLGGVYSIYARTSVSSIPKGEQNLSVYFYCDPRRVRELSAAVQRQLAAVANEGIDQDIFDKSVEALLKEYENSMQSNMYIAQSYANSSVLFTVPLSRLNRRPEIIRAVRPADIQTMCSELLQFGPAQVILYPEGWKD
ncbi:MAG: insulinase family protein [Treponema sp.]|jgi:zinc protease|nr:insulinase family protein [Treponema sp.]